MLRSLRRLSTSRPTLLPFSGKKVDVRDLGAPSQKSETTANPGDLFKKNDILLYSQKPLNYIESVKKNGFHLASNILISSPDDKGNVVGTLLVESEAFEVDLSNGGYTETNGFLISFHDDVLQLFSRIHPKPEILVVGLGKKSRMLAPDNRGYFSSLGIQLEVLDSKNAAQIFDLLATERPNVISALLLPPNV